MGRRVRYENTRVTEEYLCRINITPEYAGVLISWNQCMPSCMPLGHILYLCKDVCTINMRVACVLGNQIIIFSEFLYRNSDGVKLVFTFLDLIIL